MHVKRKEYTCADAIQVYMTLHSCNRSTAGNHLQVHVCFHPHPIRSHKKDTFGRAPDRLTSTNIRNAAVGLILPIYRYIREAFAYLF